MAAAHADVWNMPGGDLADAVARSAVLDRLCDEIGRDPATVVRSIFVPVDIAHPEATRQTVGEFRAGGFTHVVLGLPAPFPAGIAQWVADEIIAGV